MTVLFDDFEPADAYSADDGVDTRVRVLIRIVDALVYESDPTRRRVRKLEARRILGKLEHDLHRFLDVLDELRGKLS